MGYLLHNAQKPAIITSFYDDKLASERSLASKRPLYRHYAPELGRWPSRDPIEERGGANFAAGFSDGVLFGQGHNLTRLVHGSDTPWADTSSGYYTGGLATGIGATTVAGGVGWTRGGEALARNGGFHLSRHVARETTSQYFMRSLLPATRTYSETLTRSLFTGANRSLTRGRGVRDFLTTRTYSNGSSTVARNIFTNRITHYNPYRGF